jgi:hypothetical protein
MKNKGQVTIFIIIAILIVALVVLFFVFKDKIIKDKIPSDISPVYNTLISCLENDLSTGVNVLESQGGYISLPEYESGSSYMPFSSQLNFLGNPIPYWYYVSGNNIKRNNVPSIKDMENQLESFIESRARTCLFNDYYSQGYEILSDAPSAVVSIKDNEVVLDLSMDFSVAVETESYVFKEHRVTLNSDLGSLYNSALKVYNKEQSDFFLENYSIDTLRLYAPVDGVEMTCSPKIWNANKVFEDLQGAIQANTLALKNSNTKKEYFDVAISNIPSNQKVRFLNSPNWTYSFEVLPSDGVTLIANPVGNQQGLGILGFCYVPYHFVYNIKYPVLVQVMSGSEVFQFPLAVVVQRNQPREVSGGEAIGLEDTELCKDKNTLTNVAVYDSNSNPVEADISYECLESKCNIGIAKQGKMSEEFPQCINGFVTARADGYEGASVMYSTTQEGNINIYLNKLYNKNIQLKLDGQNYNKEAVIYFVSEGSSKTVLYPEQKSVQLGEGQYEIQVYIYKNSSLNLGESTQQQCVEVPSSSIGGMLGFTKQQCFDVNVPVQIISNALSGGGKTNYTFSESDLKGSSTIVINTESLPSPDSLDQLQTNYILYESNPLEVIAR